jgi:integrase
LIEACEGKDAIVTFREETAELLVEVTSALRESCARLDVSFEDDTEVAKAVSEATKIVREESGDPKRNFAGFEFYTLRHTCLTRWAPHMDPWALDYLAGHRDMNITKRYIHPQNRRFARQWKGHAR